MMQHPVYIVGDLTVANTRIYNADTDEVIDRVERIQLRIEVGTRSEVQLSYISHPSGHMLPDTIHEIVPAPEFAVPVVPTPLVGQMITTFSLSKHYAAQQQATVYQLIANSYDIEPNGYNSLTPVKVKHMVSDFDLATAQPGTGVIDHALSTLARKMGTAIIAACIQKDPGITKTGPGPAPYQPRSSAPSTKPPLGKPPACDCNKTPGHGHMHDCAVILAHNGAKVSFKPTFASGGKVPNSSVWIDPNGVADPVSPAGSPLDHITIKPVKETNYGYVPKKPCVECKDTGYYTGAGTGVPEACSQGCTPPS